MTSRKCSTAAALVAIAQGLPDDTEDLGREYVLERDIAQLKCQILGERQLDRVGPFRVVLPAALTSGRATITRHRDFLVGGAPWA